ncbi:MAG TPA: methionyl-tRNA formyltransferase [Candidatus Paceibacterota bacterium]
MKFIFFGTTDFSIKILEKLKEKDWLPKLIVTKEDKPKGRNLTLTAPAVKMWATTNNIDYLQPTTLKNTEFIKNLSVVSCELYVVCDFGKIIPKEVLDIPKHGVINVHPSLLPKLRGASPIESAILYENETGVSIMKMDEEMDHGPILSQKKVIEWQSDNPPYAGVLEKILAEEGGNLLIETLPKYLTGEIKPTIQDENKATFTKKIIKEDALINLEESPQDNLRKIRAYHIWPRAYIYFESKGKKIRTIISKAKIDNGELVIEKVIPEGKKEMDFIDFKNGYLR